jgi:hypothetical protein
LREREQRPGEPAFGHRRAPAQRVAIEPAASIEPTIGPASSTSASLTGRRAAA